jgi:DNA-binding NtrC family response regulator
VTGVQTCALPISIFLPPLRERKEDIPPLATHLLQRLCDTHSRNVTGIASEVLKAFMAYPWPGNVREMENVIEYALHLTDEGNPIRPEQLPPNLLSKKDITWSPKDFVSIEEYTKQSILILQRDHSEEQIAEILDPDGQPPRSGAQVQAEWQKSGTVHKAVGWGRKHLYKFDNGRGTGIKATVPDVVGSSEHVLGWRSAASIGRETQQG